jgi:hypothetical protein
VKLKRDKRILLIGGPKKSSAQREPQIDHIRCDVAGILGHDDWFYDYGAVVVWPNKEYLSLPKSYSAWSKQRQQSDCLPNIHKDYWQFDKSETSLIQEIDWTKAAVSDMHHRSGIRPDAKPESSADCQLIYETLRRRCISRLREIFSGITSGLRCIVVLDDLVVSDNGFAIHRSEWVSEFLLFDYYSDKHVEANPTFISENEHLGNEMHEFAKIIVTPCKFNMRLGSYDPDHFFPFPTMDDTLLGNHWYEQPESSDQERWEQVTPSDSIACKFVRPSHAHTNRAGNGKSLIFQTLAKDFTPTRGYLLLLPAVKSRQQLLSAIADILSHQVSAAVEAADSDTASDQNEQVSCGPVVVSVKDKMVKAGGRTYDLTPLALRILLFYKSDPDNSKHLSLLQIAGKCGKGGKRNDALSRAIGKAHTHLLERISAERTDFKGVYKLKKGVTFDQVTVSYS